MNDLDRIDERLLATDPAEGLDGDPAGPRGRRLRDEARRRGSAMPKTGRGTPRERLIVVIAATVTVLSSVTAIATGMFEPDPADVSTILHNAAGQAQVHLDGWRPELRAEAVWCVYGDGSTISTYASEFALDQPLTEELLTSECTSGNDLVRNLARPPADVTVCGAIVPRQDVQRGLGERGERITSGQLSDDRHRFPVVLGWDADCATAQLGTTPSVDLAALTSFDAINQAREVEISLRAAAVQHCLNDTQAHEMAEQARSHLANDWVVATGNAIRPRCYQVQLDAERGLLLVMGR